MKYVIDASVAFKWVVPEIDSDKAERLRDDFRKSVHELFAPDFFPVELGHSLTPPNDREDLHSGCRSASCRRAPHMSCFACLLRSTFACG